jgi:hypothetical protein
MDGAQRVLLAVLGPLAPNLAVGNGLKPVWISRDAGIVAAYQSDPLVHDRVTPRLVHFIVDAGRQVREAASRWRVPTLLQWAGSDRCVAPQGSAAFAASAPANTVTSVRYPALAHEIFNEPEREQVIGDLLRWLAGIRGMGQIPAAPVRSEACTHAIRNPHRPLTPRRWRRLPTRPGTSASCRRSRPISRCRPRARCSMRSGSSMACSTA